MYCSRNLHTAKVLDYAGANASAIAEQEGKSC
jgi:hypothetical protein